MAKQRKCKKCGRLFIPKVAGEHFCSPLCSMTGFFVGGGGDTTKPGAAKVGTANTQIVHKPAARVAAKDERYARVRKMLELPLAERWAVAKDFTADERAYAKRLARRSLMEEDRLTREWSWEVPDDVEEGEGIGESDDGSL